MTVGHEMTDGHLRGVLYRLRFDHFSEMSAMSL